MKTATPPKTGMNKNLISIGKTIQPELRKKKYALMSTDDFTIDSTLSGDWRSLCGTWDQLEPDRFLQNDASFRFRRFGLFYLLPFKGELLPLPKAPYFQSAGINSYAGGIQRDFAALCDSTQSNPFLHELIKFTFNQLPVDDGKANQPWEVDVHQFRIIATEEEEGEPTLKVFIMMGMILMPYI